MTIEEIKSVSIVQFLESQGYHHVYILKENYWYLSPFRTEASPSFNVSPKKNLWNDFGAGEGGNLINLVQKMNPSWNNHEVLTYLEQKIKEHHLQYSEDYEAQRKENERKEAWKQDQAAQREKAKEANTIIERIVGLSHPYPQIRNLIGCSGTMPEKLQGSFSSTRSLYKRNVRRHKTPLPHKAA